MTRHYLPALRGLFGDWAFYSCLMSLRELGERVRFAKEIHRSNALSDLIQRELNEGRSKEIANYLNTNPERFFNSLVVAVYGGDPAWHQLDEIVATGGKLDLDAVPPDAIASIGFLSFTGEERLFAVDGQHRLSGVQEALKTNAELGDDEASVIFISHKTDAAGLTRTRNLFTTLNKTATPVTKAEIIALDESDVMAIVVRELVETDSHFSEDRILVSPSTNLPSTNDTHLTTIVNLYDVLAILFSKVKSTKPIKDLQFSRPSDHELVEFRNFAVRYFMLLGQAFAEMGKFFSATDPGSIVREYRRPDGGSVLFRPAGLTMFAQLTATLVRTLSLEDAVARLGRVPTDLSRAPYEGLLWDNSSQTIDLRRQTLVRRILEYMLGLTRGPKKIEKLANDIARVSGGTVRLPERLSA